METPRHWRLKAQRYCLEGQPARPVGGSLSRHVRCVLIAPFNLHGSTLENSLFYQNRSVLQTSNRKFDTES